MQTLAPASDEHVRGDAAAGSGADHDHVIGFGSASALRHWRPLYCVEQGGAGG